MAIGLPVKANYAAGDILTATNMNDLSGTFNNVATSYGNDAGKNKVINSAFQVWQRGTSVAVTSSTLTYQADRWEIYNGPNQAMTISRQATSDTTNLPFIQYCARIQRNSGQTGTTLTFLSQPFESANSIPYAGKAVTLSFYARKGADFSPTSSNLTASVTTGTGTDQNVSTYTGAATPLTFTSSLTGTWVRYQATATLAATATELRVDFSWTPTGTAGTNDYFEVTGVQLEAGSIATPFATASGGSIQGELAMCQRYYVRTTNAGGSVIGTLGMGTAGNFTRFAISLPVTMRTAPSSVDFSGLVADDTSAGYAATAASLNTVSTNYVALQLTHSSGITQYRPYLLQAAGGGGYLGFSAEL
jgi:hypothetical protein